MQLVQLIVFEFQNAFAFSDTNCFWFAKSAKPAVWYKTAVSHMEAVQDDMEVDDGCTLYSRDLGDASASLV